MSQNLRSDAFEGALDEVLNAHARLGQAQAISLLLNRLEIGMCTAVALMLFTDSTSQTIPQKPNGTCWSKPICADVIAIRHRLSTLIWTRLSLKFTSSRQKAWPRPSGLTPVQSTRSSKRNRLNTRLKPGTSSHICATSHTPRPMSSCMPT